MQIMIVMKIHIIFKNCIYFNKKDNNFDIHKNNIINNYINNKLIKIFHQIKILIIMKIKM